MARRDPLADLEAALKRRGIKTARAAPIERTRGLVSLRMSTYSVQEFMTALAPGPVGEDDDLARRILARPADLGVGDETWQFEAVPTIRDMESGLELVVIVNLPASDLPEVVRRLGGA